MKTALFRIAVVAAALSLAGCSDTLESAAKAERPLPEKIVRAMKAKGMSRYSPVMVRIFKEEGILEVWKHKDTGRFDVIAEYDICKWSGKLGPKYMEGDRQAPEGFYAIRPHQMNPNSSYYLSFNLGYPNAFDRAHGRSGQHLMVHGACSSAGCYSMTDAQVAEIYAFARDAFRGGQTDFQVQAFPFRMTASNMARYRNDPNIKFWTMLKEGYDHFELTKVPPKVDVCGRRYVFNQVPEEGKTFSASASCPPMSQPDNLRLAYESLTSTHEAAYSEALSRNVSPPKPSIQGPKEAALVAKWSKARARGERVSREPPSLSPPPRAPAPEVRPQEEPAKEEGEPEAAAAQPAPNASDAQPAKQDNGVSANAEGAPVPEARPDAANGGEPRKRRRFLGIFGG